MRLYLINPRNPLVNLTNVKDSRWNRYRVWKPLGLLVLAGLTPPEWEITVIDENVRAAKKQWKQLGYSETKPQPSERKSLRIKYPRRPRLGIVSCKMF